MKTEISVKQLQKLVEFSLATKLTDKMIQGQVLTPPQFLRVWKYIETNGNSATRDSHPHRGITKEIQGWAWMGMFASKRPDGTMEIEWFNAKELPHATSHCMWMEENTPGNYEIFRA